MKAIIFDTETTGFLRSSSTPLEQQPRIIELGAISLDTETGELAELTQLLNPEEEISAKITEITGIENKDVVGKPTFDEYVLNLFNFFNGSDMLICHNAPFDVGMLKNELHRSINNGVMHAVAFKYPDKIVCTIQEYKSLFGKWPKMTDLYERIVGKPLMQTHRALDDCKALLEILMVDKFFEKIGVSRETE